MKDDLISRQDTIKYLMTNMNWYDEDGYESDDDYKRECITELISGVPSAQPNACENTCEIERKSNDMISRQQAIDAIFEAFSTGDEGADRYIAEKILANVPSAQPELAKDTNVPTKDCISRQAAIDALIEWYGCEPSDLDYFKKIVEKLPSTQPEQRYTEEELMVFKHGISLSLLSKRSSQHWRYDEDTATEIKFLERLYEKVVADMGGEQDE